MIHDEAAMLCQDGSRLKKPYGEREFRLPPHISSVYETDSEFVAAVLPLPLKPTDRPMDIDSVSHRDPPTLKNRSAQRDAEGAANMKVERETTRGPCRQIVRRSLAASYIASRFHFKFVAAPDGNEFDSGAVLVHVHHSTSYAGGSPPRRGNHAARVSHDPGIDIPFRKQR